MTTDSRLRLLLSSVAGIAVGLLVSMALGLPEQPVPAQDETPVYLEVDVPNRVLECVQVGDGLSCNWSDPLVATSSRSIERLPDGTIIEVDPPEVEVEP